MSFVHWPDIESFHNVRKSAEKYPHLLGGKEEIVYRGKVKLHGTNAAVQVLRDGSVVAQSRSQILSSSNDNMGFAKWVDNRANLFRAARPLREDVIYFGEWCGPGIMKGVAINQIPSKIFAVFAAFALPVADDSALIAEPATLRVLLGSIPDVHVLPWYGEEIAIPVLGEREIVDRSLAEINRQVETVEACDPWVRDEFGVAGVGEGIVYYPKSATRSEFSNLAFKAKGEKHKVVAKTAPAQIDPTVAASIGEYVQMVLTEARLEQGVRAVASGEMVFDKKTLGAFLGWICKDVEKETEAELEAANLKIKQAQKAASDAARQWYLARS